MEFIIKTAQPVPAPAAAPAPAPAAAPAAAAPTKATAQEAKGPPGNQPPPGAVPPRTTNVNVVDGGQPQPQQNQPQQATLKQKRTQDPNLEAAIQWLTDLEKASGSLTTALDYLKKGTAGIPKEDADLASVAGTLEQLHKKLDTAFRQHFGVKQ